MARYLPKTVLEGNNSLKTKGSSDASTTINYTYDKKYTRLSDPKRNEISLGLRCMKGWLTLCLPVTVPRARLLPLIDGCAARSAATAEETENTPKLKLQ